MHHFGNRQAYGECKKKVKVDKGKAKVMGFDIPIEHYSNFGTDLEEKSDEGVSDEGSASGEEREDASGEEADDEDAE